MTDELKGALDEANDYYVKTNRPGEKFHLQYHRHTKMIEHALTLAIAENDGKDKRIASLENIIYRARRDIEKHNGDWIEEILKEAGEELMESKPALDKEDKK